MASLSAIAAVILLVRIMEAVCFIVRRNIEVIEGIGVPVMEIRSLGGRARSAILEADRS